MRFFLRLLLWLWIAALPLQGGAAALAHGSGATVGAVHAHAPDGRAGDKATLNRAASIHCASAPCDRGEGHEECPACAACGACPALSTRLEAAVAAGAACALQNGAPDAAMKAYIPPAPERPPRRLTS